MVLVALLLSQPLVVVGNEPSDSLRLSDIFGVQSEESSKEVPSAPAEQLGEPNRVDWRTSAPGAPAMVIPPADWFRVPASSGNSATLGELLMRLQQATDLEDFDSPPEATSFPIRPAKTRHHEQSPIEELGRDLEILPNFGALRIENGFQRHAVELSFIPQDGQGGAIRLILPPSHSETLTLPTGEYVLARRVWNPLVHTSISIGDEYLPDFIQSQRSYSLRLRSREEDILMREIERSAPVTFQFAP